MNASPDVATFFDLMRHAPTVWNAEKRIQGQSNAPLTPDGESMARRWGQVLVRLPTEILTSDLERARHRRRSSHLGLPLTSDPRLREQDWGGWTGETLAALRARDPGRLTGARRARLGLSAARRRIPARSLATQPRGPEAAALRWPGETSWSSPTRA